jgi:hypothetical protein
LDLLDFLISPNYSPSKAYVYITPKLLVLVLFVLLINYLN